MRVPDGFFCRFRREKDNALAFVQNEPLNQHQSDERLPETNAVAKKRATLLVRDLHQRPVGLLLVTVKHGEHA